MSLRILTLVIVIGLLMNLVVACGGPSAPPTPTPRSFVIQHPPKPPTPRPKPTPRPRTTPTPTVGELIAVIDGEYGNSTYAKRGNFLASNIASWCSDSASATDVGDLATVTSNVLRDQFGIEMDVLEVLEEVKDAADETEAGVFECKDFFITYTFLRGQ